MVFEEISSLIQNAYRDIIKTAKAPNRIDTNVSPVAVIPVYEPGACTEILNFAPATGTIIAARPKVRFRIKFLWLEITNSGLNTPANVFVLVTINGLSQIIWGATTAKTGAIGDLIANLNTSCDILVDENTAVTASGSNANGNCAIGFIAEPTK